MSMSSHSYDRIYAQHVISNNGIWRRIRVIPFSSKEKKCKDIVSNVITNSKKNTS